MEDDVSYSFYEDEDYAETESMAQRTTYNTNDADETARGFVCAESAHNTTQLPETAAHICAIKEISPDVIKLDMSVGSFFLRITYLEHVTYDDLSNALSAGTPLLPHELTDITNAAFAFAAERDAVQYLSRAEHSAFLLKRKLSKKNHSAAAIERAFEYLVMRGFLSDSRYAEAFLRNRTINRAEGKTRLLAELASRGVSKEIAQSALDAFFADKSERELLVRAAEKLQRKGKTEDQQIKALLRLGFAWSDIQKVLGARDDWD